MYHPDSKNIIIIVMEIKIGDHVKWVTSSYEVVDITSKGLKLKQNFSIGVILEGYISPDEVVKIGGRN
jgi:hypothetical protein